MRASWVLLFHATTPVAAQHAYTQPTFDVVNSTNITYAQGLRCNPDQRTGCQAMDLQLEVYQPLARTGGPAVPALKPAYILAHGGGNVGGSKELYCVQGAAVFYASRGFVSFNIDYRLGPDHGLLPRAEASPDGLLGWDPDWQTGYPAVRDCKAAVRFVRANAEKYGVDPDRIVVSGGSAGATDMLAVGVTFDGDYKDEISIDEDPTLSSTHLDVSSQVQCVVTHWGHDGEIQLVQQHDPKNRSRYSKDNAPVVSFHGDQDPIIPIAHARAMQTEYAKTGVDYDLHVLKGCAHGSWCYDGNGRCGCELGAGGYGDLMDVIALPFVAKHLDLELLDSRSITV